MENSKLINNLSKLSKRQWTAFLKYLTSSYFNQQTIITTLATHLYQCRSSWSADQLNRQRLFTICFPEQRVFEWQKLKDIASLLQKQLRQFLAVEQMRNQPALQQTLLIEAAMDNDMPHIWQRQLELFKKKQGNTPLLLYQLLEKEKNNTLRQGQRLRADDVLSQQINTLEHWYWKERLRLAVESISISSVLKQEAQESVLAGIRYLPDYCETIPIIKIYWNILQMLSQEFPHNSAYFQALISQLTQNSFPSAGSEEEIYSFYIYALNYCTGRINSGDANYYGELFQIYQLLEQHQRLLSNNELSQWTFLNIVATACNLKRYQWAEQFIEKYHVYISIAHRENALHYNAALLSFYQASYDQALEHLLKVSHTDDPYYELNGRILQLRVFFEKREWILLDSLLERLRIYLMRNTSVSSQRKKESQNFIRKLRQLFQLIDQLNLPKDKRRQRLSIFLESLEDDRPLMHRKWLKRMAEHELEQAG